MIKQLTLEQIASGDVHGNWAEEVENSIGLELQGEYTKTTYSPTAA
jgi:hypothetical protein